MGGCREGWEMCDKVGRCGDLSYIRPGRREPVRYRTLSPCIIVAVCHARARFLSTASDDGTCEKTHAGEGLA